MQVRTARTTSISDCADQVSLPNALTTSNADAVQMRVQRLKIISVVNHDHIAVAIIVPTRIDDNAGIRGIRTFAFIAGNVNAPVIGVGSVIEP